MFKIKSFVILYFIIFLVTVCISENKIFFPEYIFSDIELCDYETNYIKTIWLAPLLIENNNYIKKNYYVSFRDNKLDQNYGIELIVIKFDLFTEAENSILSYEKMLSAGIIGSPVNGSFSGSIIGKKNYVQGFSIENINKNPIPEINYYETLNLRDCNGCYYYITLYVLLDDGWVFSVSQHFDNYKSWMGKLDPELLERLAEKAVEVYHSKKCKIKIEPHKWNLNWSEDNANPEGLINVWIGDLDDGISVEDIDISTIILNGEVPITKNVGYVNNENFQGKILHLQFKKKDSFGIIFFPKKGDKREICIEGKLKNGENFIGRTEIEIIGKDK